MHASILTNASKQKTGAPTTTGRLPLVFAMALAVCTQSIARLDDGKLRPLAAPVQHIEGLGFVMLGQNRL